MARHNGPWVLGISASHNGAVCLLRGDELVVAIQEERLSRRKRHRIYGAQHSLALDYCFDYDGICPSDLSMVALCVQGRVTDPDQDLTLNPCLQIKEHAIPTLIVPHHLAHAASTFATSGFLDSAILVIDGAGSPSEDLSDEERKVIINTMEENWEIISLYSGLDTIITPLEKHGTEGRKWLAPDRNRMARFNSLGGMYAAVSGQIFGEYAEAGKVMGLAPYSRPTYPPHDFFEIIEGRFVFSDKIPSLSSIVSDGPRTSQSTKTSPVRCRKLSKSLCFIWWIICMTSIRVSISAMLAESRSTA
jgi:carbamoyltransferase